jgi:RND family efflux transporter, MFP subunit
MKKIIESMKERRYMLYGVIFIIGLILGWLLFGGSSENVTEGDGHAHEAAAEEIWTCSMHPQIKQDKPGKCPLCAMDLIPLVTSGGAGIDPDAIELSNEAIALANIVTTKVSRGNPEKVLRLYGTIQLDERLSRSQVSHLNGRIEELFVNFTGESVSKGQPIANIYSPDLMTAQQELLEAAKMSPVQPALLAAAREKLRLWKLTDEQIAEIERSGKVSPIVPIVANTGGIVMTKRVEQGDYVNQGSILFDMVDLSAVWVIFDAYEVDLPYIKVGDQVDFTLQSLPGKKFSGKVSFIDPMTDNTTRTTKVRVEAANRGIELKPGMYANAIVNASLKQYGNEIIVPKTAILWTGKRSVVYVKQPNTESPVFLLREIDLGPSLGNSYVVLSGIAEGEEIVTNGVFTVDASAQLEGKRSMMNEAEPAIPKGAKAEYAMVIVGGACEMCTDRIVTTVKEIKGIYTVSWSLETKELHIDFDPDKTSADAVAKALAAVGHDAGKYKADDDVYNALPECCWYRQ